MTIALAQTVSGASAGIMAGHVTARNVPAVQISTERIFDGSGETSRRLENEDWWRVLQARKGVGERQEADIAEAEGAV